MRNKIKSHLILNVTAAILFFSCAPSRSVTVAFTDISSLETKAKVFLDTIPIGYVKKFSPNKLIDTIFVTVRLNKGVRIPVGSDFYLQNYILSNATLKVVFSQNERFMSEKDIAIGKYDTIKGTTENGLDSVKQRIFTPPIIRIDSVRKN